MVSCGNSQIFFAGLKIIPFFSNNRLILSSKVFGDTLTASKQQYIGELPNRAFAIAQFCPAGQYGAVYGQ